MASEIASQPPRRQGVDSMRTHDYLYDSNYIVSGARDYARTAFKAAMASAQVSLQPVYKTMFSELRMFPRMQVVYYPNCRLPEHMDRSYAAYMLRVQQSRLLPAPQTAGKDQYKFTARPKILLDVPSVTPDLQVPTPIQLLPSEPAQLRNRGTQSKYRETSAQTIPWQPDGQPADGCEAKPEVLFLDKLEWGPGKPYRLGDLPADFHTTEIINKLRHARKWMELVEKGEFPRWLKKRDEIISDVETKDWIFREAEIDELQDIRLELLHKMQQELRTKQQNRTSRKLAKLWAAKKDQMESKINHIRKTRDRELRKLQALHDGGGRAGLVQRMRAARGSGSVTQAACDPTSDVHAPLARHGYQARRRHAEIYYDPSLLALEDHQKIAEPPTWLEQCGQDLRKSCSGHHLPRDPMQLCERETKWSEQFLETLHNDLKKARLGAASSTAGPLHVLKPRRLVTTPRPATPEVDVVQDDDEACHQAALTLQRIIRGRAVQTLMYEGRTRAAELTEELKTTHGLQKEDKIRIAKEEARARDYHVVRTESDQKDDAITALVDELCGGAVAAALDFLEKELRRLKEERRQHAFILIAHVRVLHDRVNIPHHPPQKSGLNTSTSSAQQLIEQNDMVEKENIGYTIDSDRPVMPVTPPQVQGKECATKSQPKENNMKFKSASDDMCKKGKTSSLRKVTRRANMTNSEMELYKKLLATKIKLSKYRNKVKKQASEIKAARNIMNNPAFLNLLENLPSTAKILTILQFREQAKKQKGRRFNTEEKIIALGILKQSPKAYRFLRKIFILPAQQTLLKLLKKSNIKPGINKKIFAQMEQKAAKMKTEEKLCILLFDEMSLKSNVTYNERKDEVTGFVTDGHHAQPIFANHAQVFMVRGLTKNYKQPIAYTFSSGATKGPALASQIKEIITELQKIGFKVLATVCDQGANNRQAIKLLINETKGDCLRRGDIPNENVFRINNEQIIPLFDPPHLLKGIRNNLLTKDLQFVMNGETKIAKWHHVLQLHQENPGYKGIRLVPKLTDSHVLPNKIGKMKVKYASQVFSSTVSSNMGYLAGKGILPKECQETADLLLFFDKLFDSVNGSYVNKNKHAKPLLGPVTPRSLHHKNWDEAKKILKSMKFVVRCDKSEFVPTLNNWVWTLENIEILLKKLETEHNVTSVWMRHLNQDPIENFFGAIRSHGCRNINPTPEKFESAFTTLLINSITSVHTPGANCEKDYCEALQALVITDHCETEMNACEVDINDVLNIKLLPIEAKQCPRIMAPLTYVCGYFIRQAKRKIYKTCNACKQNMEGTNANEYIQSREYAGRNWLCYPNEVLITLVSNLQDVIIEIIKEKLIKKQLKEYLKTIIMVIVDLNSINCELHKDKLKDFLVNLVIRFFVYNYCKNINKILSGKREVDNENDYFEVLAKKYHNKCVKRKL